MNNSYHDLPGIKQSEIQKCAACTKGVAHSNQHQFFVIEIDSYLLNHGAIRRQSGLEQYLNGNAMLAFVMGPDEDLASRISGTGRVWVCQECFLNKCGSLWQSIIDNQKDLSDE